MSAAHSIRDEGTMLCPGCNSENPSEARFCRSCGTAIKPVAAKQLLAEATISGPKQSRSGLLVGVAIAAVVLALLVGGWGILYVIGVHGNRLMEDQDSKVFEPTPQMTSGSFVETPPPQPMPAAMRPADFTKVSDTLYTQKIIGSWRVRRPLSTGVVLDMQGNYSADGRAVWSGTVTYPTGQSFFVALNGTWQVRDGYFDFRVDSSNIPEIIPSGYTSTSRIVTLTDEQWTYVDAMDGDSETAFRVR